MLALFAVSPARAQVVQPYPVAPVAAPSFPMSNSPADMLATNLKILAQNPYDVTALTQAGLGALAVGDPQAALGFLARAEELSPRNARIKSALGTALTMLEKPAEALRLFGEAVALGANERDIAADRGLAYDLSGDTKRAQKDYILALRTGLDPEVTRRYALSLGIAGERKEALALLDPLIARSDQGAWRARAFVLAMNGDLVEADRIVRAVSPASMGGAMTPFLRRLASLTPSQRAHAVNFGTMPSDGTRVAVAETGETFRSVGNGAADGLIPRGEPFGSKPAAVPAETPREARARLKREKELARLAEKGRKAAGVAPPVAVAAATPVPARPAAALPPVQAPAASQRVGTRIAAIDPARLPPEMRAPTAAAAAQQTAPVVTLVKGATEMPPPDGVRPLVRPAIEPPKPAPVVIAAAPAPMVPPPAVVPPVIMPPAVAPPVAPPPVKVVAAAPVVPTVNPVPGFSLTPSVVPKPVAAEPAAPPVTQPVFEVPAAPKPEAVKISVATPQPAIPAPAPAIIAPPPVLPPPVAVFPAPVATPAPQIVTPAPASAVPVIQPSMPSPAPVASVLQLPVAAPLPAPVPPVAPQTAIAVTELPPSSVATPEQGAAPPPAVAKPEPVVATPPPVATPAAAVPATTQPANRLASVLEGIQTESESAAGPLPTAAEIRAKRLAAKRKADAEAKADADKTAADKLKADEETAAAAVAKRMPARIWVQIATGSSRSGLPITWRKLKQQSPKGLGEQAAWSAPFKATNRLLVGPFKSNSEAKAMVNRLSRDGIAATSFTSDTGQEISKLGGK
jgi:tetratricopeptide (TPR) repeat protein